MLPPLNLSQTPQMAGFAQCSNFETEQNFAVMSQFMGYSNGSFFPFFENFPGILPIECPKPAANSNPVASTEERRKEDKKRTISSGSSDPETKKRDKIRRNSKEEEMQKDEVVHVRARRGQATNSHSLAERLRREKINEKMRCLQDLVPGCYRTMGMAGMLDEIINYVQSLQNQVEFLSMKLSAASSLDDLRLELETSTQLQVFPPGMMNDASDQWQEMEKVMRGGCHGDGEHQGTCFQPAMHF